MKRILLVGLLAFLFTGCSSSKLVCESVEGDITLYYDDTQITGYTALNIEYDIDGQNRITSYNVCYTKLLRSCSATITTTTMSLISVRMI